MRLLGAARNGRLMRRVVVPVRVPETIGRVGIGFVLHDFVAEQIGAGPEAQ